MIMDKELPWSQIVFQNESVCIVDKNPNTLSVPSRDQNDPRLIVGIELQKYLKQMVLPVHRLDYEVSGLLVFALTKKAHQKLNHAFEAQQVQKTYQALTQGGSFEVGQRGSWESLLLRGKKRAYEKPWGQKALTDFWVKGQDQEKNRTGHQDKDMDQNQNQSKLQGIYDFRLYPKTGRGHQLRYELYKHQSPILGDQLYGSTQNWTQGGIALRAIELTWTSQIQEELNLPHTLSVSTI